jgi:hypothetical protein
MIRRMWSSGTMILSFALSVGLLSTAPVAFGAANTSGLTSFSARGVGIGALAAGACTSPAIACRQATPANV